MGEINVEQKCASKGKEKGVLLSTTSSQSVMRDPSTCTVLYKILTPQEKDAMPATQWAGTALDVCSTRCDGSLYRSPTDVDLL